MITSIDCRSIVNHKDPNENKELEVRFIRVKQKIKTYNKKSLRHGNKKLKIYGICL